MNDWAAAGGSLAEAKSKSVGSISSKPGVSLTHWRSPALRQFEIMAAARAAPPFLPMAWAALSFPSSGALSSASPVSTFMT